MSKFPKALMFAALAAGPAAAEPLGLGREATAAEIAAWDIDIRPDGQGLPVGAGTVADGEWIYTDQCAACHGDFGEAVGRWPVLAGGWGSLESEDPVKTVGSYWPYLSTVFDYVHRAMPFGNAQSLSDDEVYAVTAYILYLNDVVTDEDFELSNETFLDVELPNAGGFFMDDREEREFGEFTAEPCMQNCKDAVEITMRARVLDVTPETEAEADAAAEAAPEEPAGPDPELVAAGEKVFRKCQACHQVGEGAQNRTGPHLNGVFGRAAGALDGFRYSRSFPDLGVVWDDAEMAAFLMDPKGYARGTRMAFRGLNKTEEIDAVIAYIRANGG